MASGNVIGGGNFNLGEAYAQAINQNRAQAMQQQQMAMQAQMERARLQQAQRQSDMQQQLEYARLNQAATEAQRQREFQSVEHSQDRGFTSGENALNRDQQTSLENARIGSAKDLQSSAQGFQGEQNKLSREQQADFQKEHSDLQREQMTLQEKLQNKNLSQQEVFEGHRRLDDLIRQKQELVFREKQFNQGTAEHNLRISQGQQQIDINKENMLGQKDYREGQLEARNREKDPALQRSKHYQEAYNAAAKRVGEYVKSIKDTDPTAAKKWTYEEQQKAIRMETDHIMQGKGYPMPEQTQAQMDALNPAASGVRQPAKYGAIDTLDTLTGMQSAPGFGGKAVALAASPLRFYGMIGKSGLQLGNWAAGQVGLGSDSLAQSLDHGFLSDPVGRTVNSAFGDAAQFSPLERARMEQEQNARFAAQPMQTQQPAPQFTLENF